jgi:hypothetical protein
VVALVTWVQVHTRPWTRNALLVVGAEAVREQQLDNA